jgi:hypothetical protein
VKGCLEFDDVASLVRRLYSDAIVNKRFRPEQAFAYVQDETESIHRVDSPGMNAILQTAIYVEGARRGLELSKDSLYAQDMLEVLSDVYRKCTVKDLIEAGGSEEKLKQIKSEMDFVIGKFLN